jgi:hypothetical protein
MLSLYNAAHMAVPGETILDDAITFTRRHLDEAARGKLTSPMREQVSRALEIPLPRFMTTWWRSSSRRLTSTSLGVSTSRSLRTSHCKLIY